MTRSTRVRIVIEIDVPEGSEVHVDAGGERPAPVLPQDAQSAAARGAQAEEASAVRGVAMARLTDAEQDEVWWADEVLRNGGSRDELSRALTLLDQHRATAKGRTAAPDEDEGDDQL